VVNEPEAGDDEGDAQELTHVKCHALLKVYLDLFTEFYEEAERKDGCDAESKVESGSYLLLMLTVDEDGDDKYDDVSDSLIQLCRMACKILSVLYEYESPVRSGSLANYLGVHKVAKTYAGGGEWGSYAYHINALKHLDLILTAIENHADDDTDGTAMAGKSAVSNHTYTSLRHETDREQHLYEMLAAGKVIFGFIEQAVSQAGAYENTKETVKEQRFKDFGLDATVLVKPFDQQICGHKTNYPHE
jgi:hypothetical protein